MIELVGLLVFFASGTLLARRQTEDLLEAVGLGAAYALLLPTLVLLLLSLASLPFNALSAYAVFLATAVIGHAMLKKP